jgi:mannitol-1-/sugar-/sorbitol-6-/2-deoxyglucose-6-phosphatase
LSAPVLDAAIFDMDGLLVDSEVLWQQAEVEVLSSLGVPIDAVATRQTLGMFVYEVMAHWNRQYPFQGMGEREAGDAVMARVAELAVSVGTLLPGATEAIALVGGAGLKVGLASSTPRWLIDVVLEHFALKDFFSVICSAEDEPYGKPHPAVFLSAAAGLRVVPRSCLVFEDSPAGVIAAKAASMTCVAVPEVRNRDLATIAIADVVLDSLTDFTPAVLGRLGGPSPH